MLTDYHVHLRPDGDDTPASRYFTSANAEHYREVAASRGVQELGVAEHVHRFTAALDVWQHPFWRESAVDDLDRYVEFVREETDLKLGLEADYIRGRDGKMGALLDKPRLGLRRRLGALPRRSRRRLRRRDRHLALRDDAGARVDALLRGAGRVRDVRPVRHHLPPGSGEDLGQGPPVPGEGPALLLRAGRRGDARRRRGDGGLHRRAAQAGRRDLPVAGVPGDGGRRRHPDRAVLATRTSPDHLAFRYEDAVQAARGGRREGARRVRAAGSAGWSRSGEKRARDRLASLRRRATARARRGRDPARPRAGRALRRGRARARDDRRDPGRGGHGRHRPALPGHRLGVQGRGLDRRCCARRSRGCAPRAGASSSWTRP